ncbi:MAG: TatD family hydrolase [Chloroflexi bacterium]|nr:TatD family hydrolase [Chloroflexota bacterium]MCY3571869.1 TatD family hydrolase [Chloroflexota bacterium]MCY3686501.1 TatD family hydrolase [Chloroflexota bacterium]
MSQPPALFDTHAHLHDPWIGDDLPAVMARASEAGVERIVTIGCSLEDSRNALAVAERYDNVWATLGVHPHDAKDWDEHTEAEFTRMADNPKVVAIGEVGLDFYRNLSPHADQYRAFEAQLTLADTLNLPVVIHSRDAHEETYEILKSWAASPSPSAVRRGELSRSSSSSPPASGRGEMSRRDRGGLPVGVIHCFSGDAELAHRYHKLGFLISFAGPVTYPKNDALRAAATSLPLDAIVIETDCPYLSPQPQRGKRNEPANIHHTAEQIADVRRESPAAVAERTVLNAVGLFAR